MSERDYLVYLDDIILSSSKILKYTKGLTFEKFVRRGQTIDAVIRNIEILGEAVLHLPAKVKITSKNVPWAKIVATRNKVIHEYFGVDLELIWDVVKKHIPKLKMEAEIILKKAEKASEN